MPNRIDIDHYLLHFRLESNDDTASEQLKRRSTAIVKAFEAAPRDSQTSLTFLIDWMKGIIGTGKADANTIRGLAVELKRTDQDNAPTELLGFLEGVV